MPRTKGFLNPDCNPKSARYLKEKDLEKILEAREVSIPFDS